MTTPTPVGCSASVIATAICLVNLSWTVDREYKQMYGQSKQSGIKGSAGRSIQSSQDLC